MPCQSWSTSCHHLFQFVPICHFFRLQGAAPNRKSYGPTICSQGHRNDWRQSHTSKVEAFAQPCLCPGPSPLLQSHLCCEKLLVSLPSDWLGLVCACESSWCTTTVQVHGCGLCASNFSSQIFSLKKHLSQTKETMIRNVRKWHKATKQQRCPWYILVQAGCRGKRHVAQICHGGYH